MAAVMGKDTSFFPACLAGLGKVMVNQLVRTDTLMICLAAKHRVIDCLQFLCFSMARKAFHSFRKACLGCVTKRVLSLLMVRLVKSNLAILHLGILVKQRRQVMVLSFDFLSLQKH